MNHDDLRSLIERHPAPRVIVGLPGDPDREAGVALIDDAGDILIAYDSGVRLPLFGDDYIEEE